ncbi:MAG TPA: IS21 family transposase, partial [Chloroflexia bacterium]|nr:IS21 family transposase [Chloroflexia bacterium]
WALQHDLLTDPLPALEQLHTLITNTLEPPAPPQNTSSVEPYRELVLQLRQRGVEIAAITQRLQERGYRGSYSSVWRFVRALEPSQPDVCVRVETKPAEEAQVDFGYAGLMLDPTNGQLRKAWAFVMTLSFSRHCFVCFVFDQTIANWLECHKTALRFFGGVPGRLVIDNLKSGLTRACWQDPGVQAAYRECAEHYGFRIAPCRPATPQHKGKVESGVHYVKRNFLAGREAASINQNNQHVLHWCRTIAGERRHGTTHQAPLECFEQSEKAKLKPLPSSDYELAIWKLVKLGRDCYINFENAYYSAPLRLVGQQLRVRGANKTVRIYSLDFELVATHERATKPGERLTHLDHLPPEKVLGLTITREAAQATAADIGPATSEVVEGMLADPVLERVQLVGRLLKLREEYGDGRLEAACARAIRFADPSYRTIERILAQGLDSQPTSPAPPTAPPALTFIRSAAELMGNLFGGVSWN